MKANMVRALSCAILMVAMSNRVEAAKLRIMPLGDSITQGHSSTDTAGYRGLLWEGLKSAGYDVDYVGTRAVDPGTISGMDPDHEGHGGWCITDPSGNGSSILDKLPSWLGEVDAPNVILVLLGTNDSGEDDFETKGLEDMGKTLEVLRQVEPDAHVLLATVLWRSSEPNNTRIANVFNPGLAGLVEAQSAKGQKITLVDMRSKIPVEGTNGNRYFADGLHPNRDGYQLMANAWLDEIRKLYPDPAAIDDASLRMTPAVADVVYYSVGGVAQLAVSFNQRMSRDDMADASRWGVVGCNVSVTPDSDCRGACVRIDGNTSGTLTFSVAGIRSAEGVPLPQTICMVQGEKVAAPSKASSSGAYLQANRDKKQVVNLGYFMNGNSRVELDYQIDTVAGDILLGAWDEDAKLRTAIWGGGGGVKKVSFILNDTEDGGFKTYESPISIDTGRHTAILDAYNRGFSIWTAGVCEWSGKMDPSRTCNNTAQWPLVVFGSANSWRGDGKQQMSMRVFSVKIYEKDRLIHDFEPVLKDVGDGSSPMPGFQDRLSGRFVAGQSSDGSQLSYGGNLRTVAADGYLESNGSQYVNTGYKMTQKSKIEVDFRLSETGKSNILFGPWDAGAKLSTAFWVEGSHKWFSFLVGDNGYHDHHTEIVNDQNRHTVTLDVANKRYSFWTDGVPKWEGAIAEKGYTWDNEAQWPVVLFGATKDAAGTGSQGLKAKIYSVRIYESNVLVHEYVPCLKDHVSGFKDIVGGDFVTVSAGQGSLAYGGDVRCETDAYVESDGTQVLNTQYYANSKSRIEMDFQMNSTSAGTLLFGAWNTGAYLRYCIWQNGGPLQCILRTNNKADPQYLFDYNVNDLGRYTVVMDLKNQQLLLRKGAQTLKTVATSDKFGAQDICQHPMGIFGGLHNAAGTEPSMASKMKVYSVRIYEDEQLVHEFLPYKKDTVVGLYDTKGDGFVAQKHKVSVANPSISGCGWGEDHAAFYDQPRDIEVSVKGSGRLNAFAPGAVAYQWYENGVLLAGKTDSSLTVPWRGGVRKTTYSVEATFNCGTVQVKRMSEEATVTFGRPSLFIVVE